jgi:protein-disulfide isomerase
VRLTGIKLLYIFSIISFLVIGCQTPKQDGYFELDGKTYLLADISPKNAGKIYEVEKDGFDKKRKLLREEVYELYKTKINPSYREPEFSVSEAELKLAYEINQGVLPYSYEYAKKELEEYILEEKKENHITKIMKDLERSHGLRLLADMQAPYSPPKLTIASEGFPSLGRASNVLIEFGDFTCPYCKQAARDLAKIKTDLQKDFQFIFMFYSTHPSEYLSRLEKLAVCSHKQGKFWSFHDFVFIEHKDFIPPNADTIIETLKLDKEKLEVCMQSAETQSLIERSYSEAKKLGVNKTPYFFLNGKIYTDGLTIEALKARR